MRKSLYLPLSLGLACMAPSSPQARELLASTTLTKQQIASIQAAVKERLKDPDSAKFGKFAAGRTLDGSIRVCGYVNSRNSFGGFTGMSPFSARLAGASSPVIQGPVDPDDMLANMFIKICREDGLDI